MHAQTDFGTWRKYRFPEHTKSSFAKLVFRNDESPSYADEMGFGKRLQAARKAKKLSGEALGKAIAERLGYDAPLSKQTISHWENGRYEPNIEQLGCLCALLGVSADYLLLDLDQMGIDPTLQDFVREYKNMKPDQKAVWNQILSTSLPQPKRLSDVQGEIPSRKKERLQ